MIFIVLKIINDKFVVYLRAMRLSLPDAYGTFSSSVAQIIDDNNVTVKKRRNKNAK